ncbi:thiamine phosphate synthase [Actinoplanes sp. CA-030573]|uniref:thiamine phosphate synthase n=1 Tax=Actinoplanes sp. CA-030573 TaxID=3239898 RepID=UPI003D8BF1D6
MVTPSGLVLLTDRRLASGSLIRVVERAVRGGVAWVILRERDLPYAERRTLALRLRDLLPPGRLIVAGPDPLGADAVHLAEADPLPAADVALIGRSCHAAPRLTIGLWTTARNSSYPGAKVAPPSERGGVSADPRVEDYVTLSPVFPTLSKPGYGPALPLPDAAALAGEVPWLALGGIDSPSRAAACAAAGAHGIAVMGALMRADDPERVARELAAAFGAARVARAARDRRPTAAAVAAGVAEWNDPR